MYTPLEKTRTAPLLSATLLSATLLAPAPRAHAAPPVDLSRVAQAQAWVQAHQRPARWVVRAGGVQGDEVGESTLSARWDERGYIVITDRLRARRASGGAPLDVLVEREKVYQGDPPYALLEAYFYEQALGEARAGAWRDGRWLDLEEAPQVGRAGDDAPGRGLDAARAALAAGGERVPARTAETALSVVGLPLEAGVGARARVSVFDFGQDAEFELRLMDVRLEPGARAGEPWRVVREVSSLDLASGRSSRHVEDEAGLTLRTTLADALSLTRATPSGDAQGAGDDGGAGALRGSLGGISAIDEQRGRVGEAALQLAMSPARERFEECYRAAPPNSVVVTLRLDVSSAGELRSIGVKTPVEGLREPLARCVADAVTPLTLPAPTGGDATVVYPVRFKPAAR